MATQGKESYTPEEATRKLSRIELFVIRVEKEKALRMAKKFVETVKLAETLDLNDERVRLFENYFAYYLVLKQGHRNPHGINSEHNLGSLAIQESANRLLADADDLAGKIVKSERKFGEGFVRGFIREDPRIEAVFPDLFEEKEFGNKINRVSRAMTGIKGSPNFLRNTANTLSNEYRLWQADKSKQKPPLDVVMKVPLSLIKPY